MSADSVALLVTSCCGAEKVIREYHSAAAGLGFLVSFMKTKLLVAVYGSVTEEDQ